MQFTVDTTCQINLQYRLQIKKTIYQLQKHKKADGECLPKIKTVHLHADLNSNKSHAFLKSR